LYISNAHVPLVFHILKCAVGCSSESRANKSTTHSVMIIIGVQR